MLFNSNIFLLIFLPVTLIGYYAFQSRQLARIWWLIAASFVFYGYWDYRLIPLLVGSILFNWSLARIHARWPTRHIVAIGIVLNLAIIGVFKYANFFADSVAWLGGWEHRQWSIVLPLAISFFTFQQIAFLVDAKRGLVGRVNFSTYVLFVCFFPQLIAGPIVHHKEMVSQFVRRRFRRETMHLFSGGVILFSLGLAKKTILADRLGTIASPVFSQALDAGYVNSFEAWVGALAYTFQIYFDFSGYSDMAIGLALLFGIRLPTNFNSPYKARSIIDFWRRWHMTLSRFLRDYLYFPLGGNRKGPARRYINLMFVMLVGGLWHGAAWTFILWGGLHGFYLTFNHAWWWLRSRVPLPDLPKTFGRSLSWFLTFIAVVLAWVTFRAESFDAALRLYHAMFLFDGIALPLEALPVFNRLGLSTVAEHIEFFAANSRYTFYVGLLWILGAGMLALFAPNSLQLAHRFRPTVDYEQTFGQPAPEGHVARPRTGSGMVSKFRALSRLGDIRLGAGSAVATAFLFFVAFRAINSSAPTEFLYYQF